MTKTKWLIYTVMLGLVPALSRALVWAMSAQGTGVSGIVPADLVCYGLVLVVTNISGLEHEKRLEPSWKTKHIGVSLLVAILLATNYVATVLGELPSSVFEETKVLVGAGVLAAAATGHSLAVWHRIARLPNAEEA